MPTDSPLILVLGTAEWNAPIATNQHYVSRELAKEFNLVFAEGVGTRRPSFSKNDLRRIAGRLQKLARRGVTPAENTSRFARPVPERVQVVSPVAVPFHTAAMSPVNSRLLARSFQHWLDHDGPKVLWSFTPFTYGFEKHADFTVYHLVDLLHENPGASRTDIFRAERALAPSADLAIATSPAIGEHLQQQGFGNVEVKLNVADVEVFEKAKGVAKEEPPVVIFAGNLRSDKLDTELLLELANDLRGKATLRLIGPSGLEPGDRSFIDDLRRAGADIRDAMPIEDLAIEIARSRVGIIPYRINELTKGISPLKTYEYLAAGIPVVSTPLPSMGADEAGLRIYPGLAPFIDVVAQLAKSSEDSFATSRHSWTIRGREYRALLSTRVMNQG